MAETKSKIELVPLFRLDKMTRIWHLTRMKDLKDCDIYRHVYEQPFTFHELDMWRVLGSPYLNEQDIWTVEVDKVDTFELMMILAIWRRHEMLEELKSSAEEVEREIFRNSVEGASRFLADVERGATLIGSWRQVTPETEGDE